MKLRILNNSLRLRLTQTELLAFENDRIVEAKICFPGNSVMHYVLIWSDDEEHSVKFSEEKIMIKMSKSSGQQWLSPAQVGIDSHLTLDDKSSFRLLIEKDFKCLTERTEEDETDLFANPNSAC